MHPYVGGSWEERGGGGDAYGGEPGFAKRMRYDPDGGMTVTFRR